MNPIGAVPEFNGYDLIDMPVSKWIKKFNNWNLVNDIPIERKRGIMEGVIDSPAQEMFQEAVAAGGILAPGGAMALAPIDPTALAAVRNMAHTANWNLIQTWFQNTFNGQAHQRTLRANLPTLYQKLQETPRQFYIRIGIALRDAGYQQVVIEDLAESIWMNGVHQDVKRHVNGLAHLDFNDQIKAADGFWNSTIAQQPIHQSQRKANPRNYRSQLEQESEEEEYEVPKRVLKRPAKAKRQEPEEDPAIKELRQMMEGLKVNLVNLQKSFNGPGPRVQRFYNNNNRRDQLDPQDRYYRDNRHQNQERDNRACYLCNKEGHFANRCPTRTWQQGDNQERRPQVNTVGGTPFRIRIRCGR